MYTICNVSLYHSFVISYLMSYHNLYLLQRKYRQTSPPSPGVTPPLSPLLPPPWPPNPHRGRFTSSALAWQRFGLQFSLRRTYLTFGVRTALVRETGTPCWFWLPRNSTRGFDKSALRRQDHIWPGGTGRRRVCLRWVVVQRWTVTCKAGPRLPEISAWPCLAVA